MIWSEMSQGWTNMEDDILLKMIDTCYRKHGFPPHSSLRSKADCNNN